LIGGRSKVIGKRQKDKGVRLEAYGIVVGRLRMSSQLPSLLASQPPSLTSED
jgi:hypothetical protein